MEELVSVFVSRFMSRHSLNLDLNNKSQRGANSTDSLTCGVFENLEETRKFIGELVDYHANVVDDWDFDEEAIKENRLTIEQKDFALSFRLPTPTLLRSNFYRFPDEFATFHRLVLSRSVEPCDENLRVTFGLDNLQGDPIVWYRNPKPFHNLYFSCDDICLHDRSERVNLVACEWLEILWDGKSIDNGNGSLALNCHPGSELYGALMFFSSNDDGCFRIYKRGFADFLRYLVESGPQVFHATTSADQEKAKVESLVDHFAYGDERDCKF